LLQNLISWLQFESLFKDVVLNHFCCQEEGNQSFKVITLLTHFLSDISLQQQTEYYSEDRPLITMNADPDQLIDCRLFVGEWLTSDHALFSLVGIIGDQHFSIGQF
jgi:hypothetical protein